MNGDLQNKLVPSCARSGAKTERRRHFLRPRVHCWYGAREAIVFARECFDLWVEPQACLPRSSHSDSLQRDICAVADVYPDQGTSFAKFFHRDGRNGRFRKCRRRLLEQRHPSCFSRGPYRCHSANGYTQKCPKRNPVFCKPSHSALPAPTHQSTTSDSLQGASA